MIETIKVNGKPVDIDLEKLVVGDISEDMDRVASVMAYWGAVWAAAEQEKTKVDASYRAWRAKFARGLLEKEPKLAEWKVRGAVEAAQKFEQFKDAIAQAARNVVLARTHFESYRIKANVLQSRGAMLRTEHEKTGLATKVSPKAAPSTRSKTKRKRSSAAMAPDPERAASVDALKKLNLKKPKE